MVARASAKLDGFAIPVKQFELVLDIRQGYGAGQDAIAPCAAGGRVFSDRIHGILQMQSEALTS